MTKPQKRPHVPHFSSGPCAKRPGWSLSALDNALIARSHRSPVGRARLKEVIDRTRRVLAIPSSHRIAIMPASDTGAVEAAMWSLLGPRGVDVLAWEAFGSGWVTDAAEELRLPDLRRLESDYGELPDLGKVDWRRDVVFPWNGTTSGVMVPDGNWIAKDREGLAICDATSAVFSLVLPWDRLDVVTWSWQKALGGEAAHGMIVIGPRAAERLASYRPSWPVPKLFRLTKGDGINEALFDGDTINTPSMLCVEDVADALRWAEQIGGGSAMVARTSANFARIESWVAASSWIAFLAADPAIRSRTSVCFKLVAPWFQALAAAEQRRAAGRLAQVLEEEKVAYDIGAYRAAPPGLRIWSGATVEPSDLEALFPWLDWAHGVVEREWKTA